MENINYTNEFTGEKVYYSATRSYTFFLYDFQKNDELKITDKGVVWTLDGKTDIVCWERVKRCIIDNYDSDGVDMYLDIITNDSTKDILVHIQKYKYDKKALSVSINKAYSEFKNKNASNAGSSNSLTDDDYEKYETGLINCSPGVRLVEIILGVIIIIITLICCYS